MCLLSGKSCSPSGKLHVLAASYKYSWSTSKFRCLQVSFGTFANLLRLLLFEEAFITVMKLSVSILEANSMHLCHLQLCFSIDQIQSIYVHKQISMTSYVIEIPLLIKWYPMPIQSCNKGVAGGGNLAEQCWVLFELQQILSRAHWSLICGDRPFCSLKQVLMNAFSDSSNAMLVPDGYVMAVIKKSDFLYLFDITCTKFAGSFWWK